MAAVGTLTFSTSIYSSSSSLSSMTPSRYLPTISKLIPLTSPLLSPLTKRELVSKASFVSELLRLIELEVEIFDKLDDVSSDRRRFDDI